MNNPNENEPPPIEYTGPKGLPTKESWEKCTTESALFNEIRYHSYPFAAPPQPVIKKKYNDDSRLEKALDKKFRAGRHRHSDYLSSLGAWIQPGFLFLVMPFYLVFYVFPSWVKQMVKWLWQQIILLFVPIKVSILLRIKKILAGITNRIAKVVNAIQQLIATIQSKLAGLFTPIIKGYELSRNRIRSFLKRISDLRNFIPRHRPLVIFSRIQRLLLNIFRPLHLAREKIKLSFDSWIKSINKGYLHITQNTQRAKQRLLKTFQSIIDFPKNCIEKIQLLFKRLYERLIQLKKKLLQGPNALKQRANIVTQKGRAQFNLLISTAYKKIYGSLISIFQPIIARINCTMESVDRFFKPVRAFLAKHTKSIKAFRQEVRRRLVEFPHLAKTTATTYMLKAVKYCTEIMKTGQSESEGALKLLPKPIRNRVAEIKQAIYRLTNPITSFVSDIKTTFKKRYKSIVLNMYYMRLWRRVLVRYGMEVARAKAHAIYQNYSRLHFK